MCAATPHAHPLEDTSLSLIRGCSVPSTICGHDAPPTTAGKSLCQTRSFCFCLSQTIILTVLGLRSVRGSYTVFGDECGQEVRAAVVVHLPCTSLFALRSALGRHCRRCSASLVVCAQVPEHVQMKSRTLVSQVVNFEQDNALEREMVWCPNWRCATTAGLHILSKSLAERRRIGCTGCLPAAVAARPDSERAVSSARSSGLWWSRSPWTKRGGSRPRSTATRRRVRHRHRPTIHDSCSDSTHA